ncbi:hypothetical protein [Arthrobacter sp. KK5.5]|uniref:hypothetical protein n=1 Tax=Arthrobacter sp. KK5.5 TaxID=3373084 RepID=UPI003EE73F87
MEFLRRNLLPGALQWHDRGLQGIGEDDGRQRDLQYAPGDPDQHGVDRRKLYAHYHARESDAGAAMAAYLPQQMIGLVPALEYCA